MIWHTVPRLFQMIYPERIWKKSAADNTIFLTFDDGPVPGVTDFVLEELAKRNQNATFFVVGDNVAKNPSLAKDIVSSGHKIGNHTFNHLHGWKTEKSVYLDNIELCDKALQDVMGVRTKLFRPPYGLISSRQAVEVSKFKQIVMWSMLSGDYDQSLDPELVLRKSIKHSKEGCVAVFHDQLKTKELLPKILPQYLDYIQEMGWKTDVL
ncbi:Peptidoglycan/xylan/chitin deacetylase, PgdA/CDA1 family [Algoriphagus locisalis]|uniref:Peptidoglycan/xylan/chitin deacetylase, PgdA/CDA1 family n=1 Tax=Algoriphagus locisalis TaxID=305507 RepID=A0A1I6ZVX7_9BACT|nr:polysaccharide deacetylase family protein [Algoriphagus locisalis]SFT66849.1 Peptidoglycan/xylan/chitin deacetylase, PgdA/CDA1 family [Algoriphagus locisalis]